MAKVYHVYSESLMVRCASTADYWSERDVIARHERVGLVHPHLLSQGSDLTAIKAAYDALQTINRDAQGEQTVNVYYIDVIEVDGDGKAWIVGTPYIKADTVGKEARS